MRRQVLSLQGDKGPLLRFEAGVTEFQRRQFFASVPVMPNHFDLLEQRDAVQRVTLVNELICPHLTVGASMRLYDDFPAALGGANFEPSPIIGEWVRTGLGLVIEVGGDEEMSFVLEIVVSIANLFQTRLVPTVRPVLAAIRLVLVFDPVAEWVFSARKLPGKDRGGIIRLRQGGGIR